MRVFRFKESYVFSIYSWIASDYTAKYNLVVKKENRHSIALKFSVFEHKRWITKAKNSNNFHEKVWEFFALRRGSNLWILAFQTKRVFQHFPLVSVIQHFVSFCESWCTTLFGWHAQPQFPPLTKEWTLVALRVSCRVSEPVSSQPETLFHLGTLRLISCLALQAEVTHASSPVVRCVFD